MSGNRGTFNKKLWRRRSLLEHLARYGITLGGISVIVAIGLIFFYLLYVVIPIFRGASLEPVAHYAATDPTSDTLWLAMEEQGTMAVRYLADGRVQFFNTRDGTIQSVETLPLNGRHITAVASPSPAGNVLAFGTDDGRIVVVRHRFELSYPDNQRTLTPVLEFPFGESAIALDPKRRGFRHLAFQWQDEEAGAAAITDDGRLLFSTWVLEKSFLNDLTSLAQESHLETPVKGATVRLLLSPDLQFLYRADESGTLDSYKLKRAGLSDPDTTVVVTDGASIDHMRFLLGDYSLLIADSRGGVTQWFPVRDSDNRYQLTRIREFRSDSALPVSALVPEHRRKGFLTADRSGHIGIYYTTAGRSLLNEKVADKPILHMALSPRGESLLAEDTDHGLYLFTVHNEHPEISWSVLWQKVWYEGYPEPGYTWQSSAANNDFEPKFSLVPLVFGTFKAAFYAMLFAIPLALMGAVYAAQFMCEPMRRVVKPTIEIMAALPTVILGFLAGLWLAPLVENHLPGIASMLVLFPAGMLMVAWIWSRLPGGMRNPLEGWEALLLLPVVVLLGWLAMAASAPLETRLFNGNIQGWLREELGIHYDQRNALIVGIAMGFAVIPTIFSIAEDAIFSVPKHLIQGSLALGATRWQTLVGVVLPTASPAIFSALMMGFGRAVGETMIVLMATGNTPVMDLSIFDGMRTLSANIAVEMPETEVNSTHFRVLFLAALVLFLLTFLFNTAAEFVRQRLREKYSSL